ncbi:SAM-dependent methyltransferase [Brevundimonas sp. SL130]|uniref:SAM-dependent methyltransferase n=1 Tax=Brevundimonas sp. SL130 TaxID=2995143 RepID=UPI00226CF4C7|nr:class I SAM-dependent methyltransferase [Brevundimonas sp. SL130]WAC61075.1 class I SAM-dependent methyltransferase [Brevundimonas sp. SL130]
MATLGTGWDARYAATQDYVFGTAPSRFLLNHAKILPAGSRILAPADGEGRNSVYLASLGHHVVATDISPSGQDKARRLAHDAGVEVDFRIQDLQGWDWPQAEYDVVAAIFIQFAEPAFRDAIFDGMKRAVKPGGLILLHGYTPRQLEYGTGGPSQVDQLYTAELLDARFSDFDVLTLDAYDAELNEGSGHHGMSALIDLIARRPEA